jgi:CheY-like chemotaxis protein
MFMNARRIKVLIADCHEDALITLERLLEGEGYDTTTAWTGQDALKAVQGQVFDLALVNEYLPDMDAEDFISVLQRRGGNVPCIVMQPSATEITDIGRFLAAGAVAVVCKWSQTKVLETVYALGSPTSTMRTQRRGTSS